MPTSAKHLISGSGPQGRINGKSGRRHPRVPPPPPRSTGGSGGEHLRRQIPQLAVKSHVPTDRGDPTCPSEPSGWRPTGQATSQQVFLAAIQHRVEIVRHVLRPPDREKLRRRHTALGNVRILKSQGPPGKVQLLA